MVQIWEDPKKEYFKRVNQTLIFPHLHYFVTRATPKFCEVQLNRIIVRLLNGWAEVQYVYQSKKIQLKLRAEEDYSLICCARIVYRDNQWNLQRKCASNQWNTIWRDHWNDTKRNLRIEWMDGMNGIDEWNVKRARMFCLFVLNFQWSIYFLRKTKAETSCLWIEDSSQIMRWRKGIVHQKSIPPKTINQSMGWKMCQWSKTKYEKIIEMIQRKCER